MKDKNIAYCASAYTEHLVMGFKKHLEVIAIVERVLEKIIKQDGDTQGVALLTYIFKCIKKRLKMAY